MSHKLRDTWVNGSKLKKEQAHAETDINALRAAVDELRENRYPVKTASDVLDINAETVRAFIEEGKADYLSRIDDKFFPQELLDAALNSFDKALNACVEAANTIYGILGHYSGVSLKMDSKGRVWFAEKELQAFIQEKCTERFTPEEKQYYELLGNVVDSLNALLDFEKQQGWVKFSLKEPWQNTPYIQDAFRGDKEGYSISKETFLDLKKWEMICQKDATVGAERKKAQQFMRNINGKTNEEN